MFDFPKLSNNLPNKILIISTLYLSSLLMAGCGFLSTRSDISNHGHLTYTPPSPGHQPRIKKYIKKTPLYLSDTSSTPEAKVEKSLRIPVELNSHVQKWVTYFTTKDRLRFQRFLDRGQYYRDVVETVLEENDLPAELYYLAMIESGYQTHARSHAKAVGVWQFIAGTGERYGLRIDREVDERKDPIRSTEAAAKYLRDLYNVFGSWHLAMAAYNAGEIRILRAVMKGRTRNFWELTRLGVLPKETANYVPKFLAVVMIGMQPEKYGFYITASKEPYPSLEAVAVPSSISLNTLASKTGVPLATIKKFNPHLLKNKTPRARSDYEMWFPVRYAPKVAKVKSELRKISKQNRAIASSSRSSRSRSFHIVKRGENLTVIAKKYKVSVGHLMRINKLKSSRIYVGTKLRTQAKSYKPSKVVRYKVRRGDNLTIIARKFKTTPKKIKIGNRLKKNRIYAGQVLKIVKGL